MNNNYFPPLPHIELPDDETIEKMQNTDYSKNLKVKNASRQFKKDDKKRKHAARVQWWKSNWIGITTLIVGILTLIATVVFGILGLIY